MTFSRTTYPPLLDFTVSGGPQVWLVVFMDPPTAAPDAPWPNRLLSRLLLLLRPGFQHVLAVSPVGRHRWLVCNPGSCHLGLGLSGSHAVLRPIQSGVANGSFHCLAVLADPPTGWRLRPLFTCANVIAHLIGAKGGFLLTPYRLYRQIRAMQA